MLSWFFFSRSKEVGHTSLREEVTGAKCLTVLQLGLLLQRIPLPAFLFHFRVQVRREQRQGCSGHLSPHSQSCKWRRDSFFPLTTEILCSALLQGTPSRLVSALQ